MPRPLRRRPAVAPSEVTIRRIGADRPIEVVSPETLLRRKEEAEWQQIVRAHGLDLEPEHALLALTRDAIITAPGYTNELWWFVSDVNGIDRTITAATILFDHALERAFPFEFVRPFRLWHHAQRNEAGAWIELLDERLPQRRHRRRRRRAA